MNHIEAIVETLERINTQVASLAAAINLQQNQASMIANAVQNCIDRITDLENKAVTTDPLLVNQDAN